MPTSAAVPPRAPSRPLEPDASQSDVLFGRFKRDGDRAAREALVLRFLPLARSLARRYSNSSVPYEDLIQVASLGLVKAIDRFDPERGTAFQSFAIPTILGELKRYFRDSAWALHVTRGAQERALAIEEANDRLINRLGRSPTVPEIAEYLELGGDEVLEGLLAAQAFTTTSLDAPPRSPEENSESAVVGQLGAEDERYELVDAAMAVADALPSLPQSSRQILRLRFLEEMTQSEIGAQLGLSQMQVSRLLRRSLERLRTLSGADG